MDGFSNFCMLLHIICDVTNNLGEIVNFKGLIATHRSIRRDNKIITMINIGYDNEKYIDITTYFYVKIGKSIFIEGSGIKENNNIIVDKIKKY